MAPDAPAASALRTYAYHGHVAQVAHLLQEGVDPNASDQWGRTPLILAAGAGHEATVRVLIAGGASVDPYEDYTLFDTPLTAAAAYGHLGIVKQLVRAGASPARYAGPSQATAQFYARQNGHLEVWEFLRPS